MNRKGKPDRWGILKSAQGTTPPPERKRRAKAPPKAKIPEKNLQAMAEALCIRLGIRFFRIPDKLMGFLATSAPAWVRIFVAGYFAGVPDLMLFKRLPDGTNQVKFIEIKTIEGKLSQGQLKWHSGLEVKVCYGWEEVEKSITEFKTE